MSSYRVCNNSNTTVETSGTGTAHLSIAREFTLGCLLGLAAQSLLFCAGHCCPFAHFLLAIAIYVRLRFTFLVTPYDIFLSTHFILLCHITPH